MGASCSSQPTPLDTDLSVTSLAEVRSLADAEASKSLSASQRQSSEVEDSSSKRVKKQTRFDSLHRAPSIESIAPSNADTTRWHMGAHGEACWSAEGWIKERNNVAAMLASALLAENGRDTAEEEDIVDADAQLKRVMALKSERQIKELLRKGLVLEKLAKELWDGVRALQEQPAATARALHEKFASVPSLELELGSGATFFKGLEGLLGDPSPNLTQALRLEHCDQNDSERKFTTKNSGITTSSQIEYLFVADGTPDGLRAELPELGLASYPAETRGTFRRQPRPPADFAAWMRETNSRLAARQSPILRKEELLAARLYSGPLYLKYNLVLRAAAEGELEAGQASCRLLFLPTPSESF